MLLKIIQSLKYDYRLVLLALFSGVLFTVIITSIVSVSVSYVAAQNKHAFYQDVSKTVLAEFDKLEVYLQQLSQHYQAQQSFSGANQATPGYIDTQFYTAQVTADRVPTFIIELNKKGHRINYLKSLDSSGKETVADVADVYYPIREANLGTQLTQDMVGLDVSSVSEMKRVLADMHNQAGVQIAAIKAKTSPFAGVWWSIAVDEASKPSAKMVGALWLKVDFAKMLTALFKQSVILHSVNFYDNKYYAEQPGTVTLVDMAQSNMQLQFKYANQEIYLSLSSNNNFSASGGIIFASAIICMVIAIVLVVYTNFYVRRAIVERENQTASTQHSEPFIKNLDQVSLLTLATSEHAAEEDAAIAQQVRDYLDKTRVNIARLVSHADNKAVNRSQLVAIFADICRDSEAVGAVKLVDICSEYSPEMLLQMDVAEILNQIQKITTLFTELVSELKVYVDDDTSPLRASR